ncbi:MAG: lipopolysaccharide assembly protein LapB [Gammaproteobacteria bacterium]|nr:MAG: lipopolysaccharide assembly protein LapB [Gammaproteobacteria bacterium]
MMEWLFLLLPTAALSGWLSARSHYKKSKPSATTSFNPDYFKGLNFLLNEQPDKAIDVFIHLLEVNSETVETHLALANLFRRRGETDRAIRIHQNLIARPTLSTEQRDQALIELGLDYMHAGVLDRAENIFLELLNESSKPPLKALEQLLNIYQQEKEWLKAITVAKQILPHNKATINPIIAQFYCELAEQEQAAKNSLTLIKHAYSFDANCVRASLLEAKLHISHDKYQKALNCLHHIEQQNHHYLSEVIPLLDSCYQQLNKLAEFEQWLHIILLRYPAMTSVRVMLTSVINKLHGSAEAQDFLHTQLKSHPSVEGLHCLIALGNQTNPILVPLVKNITESLVQRGDRYSCTRCGFGGKKMHWHCPSCKQWGAIQPSEIHLSSLEKLLESST